MKSRGPRVSVIIPTFARPLLLPRAIESARAAGTGVEIIVVDDASTDDTSHVCESIPDIKYVRLERNQGTAGARNVGLLNSTGEYVTFLDDDDLRLPQSIDGQVRTMDDNPGAAFTCGSMILVDQHYQPTGEITFPQHPSGDVFRQIMELDFTVMGLSSLIRKECLLRVGLLRRNLKGIDDWDLFVRLAELFPIVVSTAPVGIYRKPTARSGQGSSANAAQLARVARHQLALLRLPRAKSFSTEDRRAIRRRLVNRIIDVSLWNAGAALRAGELASAWDCFLLALKLNPLRLGRGKVFTNGLVLVSEKLKRPSRKQNGFKLHRT
jgi:glycosyltransferase involved in cell wall biosynthesis